jgi:hypothetical protein
MLLHFDQGEIAMPMFLRTIASSKWKPVFTAAALTLILLIAAGSIVFDDKIQASGTAQDRVYKVREGIALDKVIRIEDVYNINSPEFPKGFQLKIKNLSKKPIYSMLINVHLKGTDQFRLRGNIWFEMEFGHPKLSQASLRIEDLTQDDLKEYPMPSLEPDKSILLGIDDELAEYVRKQIEMEFGHDNPATKNLDMTVQVINFGDGTSYIIGRPYPNKSGF